MNMRTAVEQELWDLEAAYCQRLAEGDLEGYLDFMHADFLGWPNHQPGPLDRAEARALLSRSLPGIRPGTAAFVVKPAALRVCDTLGIVFGEIRLQAMTTAGEEISSVERFIHTWTRTAAGWKLLAGMSAPLDPPPS